MAQHWLGTWSVALVLSCCSVKQGTTDGVVFGGKGAEVKELPLSAAAAASATSAAGPCAQGAPPGDTALVDDFEDGDGKPFKAFEREAWWFTASDHTPGSTVSSLEQFLAVERGLGAETPHTSLTFAVGNDGPEVGSNLSFARGGTPIPKWIDPARAFDALFGQALGASADSARQRRLGQSVLDAVRGDLRSLALRAPASERLKLEQHQVALRELEKRLTAVERQCAAPARPDAAAFPRLKAYAGGEPYFEAITELQIDLLARALACDLTRFASLFLADLSRTQLFAELPADIHSDVAHLYDARTATHPGAPATWQALALQNRLRQGRAAPAAPRGRRSAGRQRRLRFE